MRCLLFGLLAGSLAWGAIHRNPISRGTAHFVKKGIFQGGEAQLAALEGLRLGRHKGFERWVWDFSDAAGSPSKAPRFQLRYDPGKTFLTEQGETQYRRHPRFILELSSLSKVSLDRADLKRLSDRSTLVREIHLYPPIEKGDRVMELILSRGVSFAPHQPIERAGRLVLDLRPE